MAEQVVGFMVNGEEYGINILQIREIKRLPRITKLPQTEECVKGIIELRGKLVTIMDLRKRLGFQEKEYGKDTRIIIIDRDNLVGLVVDSITKTYDIKEVTPLDSMLVNIDERNIEGISKFDDKIIIILNIDEVLKIKEGDV